MTNTDRNILIENQIRDSMSIASRRRNVLRMMRDVGRVLPIYCDPGPHYEAALAALAALKSAAMASITARKGRHRGQP